MQLKKKKIIISYIQLNMYDRKKVYIKKEEEKVIRKKKRKSH